MWVPNGLGRRSGGGNKKRYSVILSAAWRSQDIIFWLVRRCFIFSAISYCASFTKWLGYFVWHFHCAVDIKHQRNVANKGNYLWGNMLLSYCLNANQSDIFTKISFASNFRFWREKQIVPNQWQKRKDDISYICFVENKISPGLSIFH